MSASWSTQREALAIESLRGCGRVRLQVRGESMLPTLWPGDLAEIKSCSLRDVRRGDVVLAVRDGRLFLHRFQGELQTGDFMTRGDSMPGPDPMFPADAFLGKLVSIVPPGQAVSTAPRPWTRLAGLLFCYFGIARRVALRLHGRPQSAQLPITDLETT